MIKIQNLNKYYNKGKENEIHVINNVTLELPNSGLISFLGPSGSGKTTLLNVIGGLDKAKGTILYDDLNMESYNMHKIDAFRSKEIGYVFQNYNLLLEETVYSNLEIALEMIGIYDKEEQEKRIEYTLKAVGMYKYRKKRAYALSGGQQQRVSIARALVKKAKIIIADEPTGNLDSENTIEVMNILKKISKSSLVLIVTHNEEVANFYSDQVIKIQDGLILDSYQNEGMKSLKTEQANTIYLKDLNLKEEAGEFVTLKYYGSDDLKPLELRIIEKNGTYFISSNEKLKLLEETNIKVLDSHYQALEQSTINEFDYDTSWYQEDKRKENIFKRIGHALKISFNKMRFGKRRAKFLYFAFFMIGVLLSICVIGFSNFIIIDESTLEIDPNFNIIQTDEYASQRNYVDQYTKVIDSIENVTLPCSADIYFIKILNYSERIDTHSYQTVISYKGSEKLKFIVGKAPEKGEIVFSKKYADKFLNEVKQYYPDYDSMLGLKFGVESSQYIVSGIVDNDYELCYMNDESYILYLEGNNYNRGKPTRSFEIEKKYDTYTIIAGRDLIQEDKESTNILMSAPYKHLLGKTYYYGKTEYTVVGIFDFKAFPCDTEQVIIRYSDSIENGMAGNGFCYEYKKYDIVEGKAPVKYDECIVSVYSPYEVGDIGYVTESNIPYKIVGKYISDDATTGKGLLFSRELIMLDRVFYHRLLWFQQENIDVINEMLDSGFYVQNIYTYYHNILYENQTIQLLVFGLLSLVLIITIAIFIYFIMRSRMISDIYPIGVYRSLGASRFRIILRFVSDIIVVVTLTSLIGYGITTIVYDTIVANVNDAISLNALKSSYVFSLLGVVLLYVLNLIFGLFPILMLMRKTPAEIISKYDI